MNAWGRRLRMQIVGESHGEGVGILLDGVPPGIPVDPDRIQTDMDARRPGTGPLVSQRNESDRPRLLSGTFEDKTTGAPLLVWIANEDTRSKDYSELRRKPRPGHSDLVARFWSRGHYDHRGGGHYSGRLTAGLVAAAALLRPLLEAEGIEVAASLHQVGAEAGPDLDLTAPAIRDRVAASGVHTAHADLEESFLEAIDGARRAKDSIGGVVRFQADGVPAAWGDPFFDPVESTLAHILFAVPAVKGVSFGAGFGAPAMHGSVHNDPYRMQDGRPVPVTNHAGGVLGGRTTGAPVWGDVAVKPASSIFQPQDTVDLDAGEDAVLELAGRHDPCIAVRAVPVVRACVELALLDLLLLARQEGHARSAP